MLYFIFLLQVKLFSVWRENEYTIYTQNEILQLNVKDKSILVKLFRFYRCVYIAKFVGSFQLARTSVYFVNNSFYEPNSFIFNFGKISMSRCHARADFSTALRCETTNVILWIPRYASEWRFCFKALYALKWIKNEPENLD